VAEEASRSTHRARLLPSRAGRAECRSVVADARSDRSPAPRSISRLISWGIGAITAKWPGSSTRRSGLVTSRPPISTSLVCGATAAAYGAAVRSCSSSVWSAGGCRSRRSCSACSAATFSVWASCWSVRRRAGTTPRRLPGRAVALLAVHAHGRARRRRRRSGCAGAGLVARPVLPRRRAHNSTGRLISGAPGLAIARHASTRLKCPHVGRNFRSWADQLAAPDARFCGSASASTLRIAKSSASAIGCALRLACERR
jgi:hypothetical protein